MDPRLALRAAVVCTVTLSACGLESGSPKAVEEAAINGDADTLATSGEPLSKVVEAGTALRTTAELNLRTGPSLEAQVRLVMPKGAVVTAVDGASQDGWYAVKYGGTSGWSSGRYLELAPDGDGSKDPSARDAAIARAKEAVGFSYWWGSGTWLPGGLSASTKGTCTGSCPECTHTGRYGADCSGYVAKVWQVPATNGDPRKNTHPYTTLDFVRGDPQWQEVDRAALVRADALAYNIKGRGHIVLYESGDGWGQMWMYEARGCAYGIVRNLRSLSSSFKGLRHHKY